MNLGKMFQKLFTYVFTSVILSSGMASPLLAMEPKEILARSLEAQFQLDFEGMHKTEFHMPGRSYIFTTKVIGQKPGFTYTTTLAPSRIKELVTLDDGKFRIEHIRGSNKSEFFPSLNSPEAREIKKKSLNLRFTNYKISRLLDGYVLGRPVYVISLTSKHPGNPWRKVWIDKKTFLRLKQEDYDWQGKLVSTFYYTKIHFNKQFSKDKFYRDFPQRLIKRPFFSRERFLSLEEMRRKIRFPVSTPHNLPPGYEFQEALLLFKGRVLKLTYTNGIGVICLSQMPSHVKLRGYPEMSGEDFQGGHPLVWRKGGKTFDLRGNISPKELVKVAQSVK